MAAAPRRASNPVSENITWGFLGNRSGVHIGANEYGRAGPASIERCDQSIRTGDPVLDLQP